jgi:cellulose synthase/poly-beta-1,6-N-acetylglucosamine synthase-like glycosyltransferase
MSRSAAGSSSEEAPLKWNKWVRQTHRWLSIVFTLAVIVTFVALQQKPPLWVSYLPLPPLFLLLFSGLYLFALPYVAKWRSGRRSD